MAHGELQSLFSLEDDIGAASGMQYRYDKKIFYKIIAEYQKCSRIIVKVLNYSCW